MKKSFTIFKIVFAAITVFATMPASAQIVDLDPAYYYMIQTSRADAGIHPALGISTAEKDMDEALLEKQTPDGFSGGQLWQVIPVSENTYIFKNKASGMALGRSSWRGKRPDIINDPTNVWHFDAWSGHPPHFGVCQRLWVEGDSSQMWTPLAFDIAMDTVRYRMTNADNLNDSTWSFNLWRGDAVIHAAADAYQNKNIALADGELEESSSWSDATSGYSYIFTKSLLEVPASAIGDHLTENIHVYSNNGSIILRGELYGKNVEVYSILGTRVYSAQATSSELNIAIKRGLYIVKAGNMITKLVIE